VYAIPPDAREPNSATPIPVKVHILDVTELDGKGTDRRQLFSRRDIFGDKHFDREMKLGRLPPRDARTVARGGTGRPNRRPPLPDRRRRQIHHRPQRESIEL
jgi:hypothetical protein